MKIILTADWLDGKSKPKLLWIKDIRDYFGFGYKEVKVIADYFWFETNNLEKSDFLVIDTEDFEIFKNFKLTLSGDLWINRCKSIKPYENFEYVDPFSSRADKVNDEIENLILLVPENNKEEARVIIGRLLDAQTAICHPFAAS